MGARVRSWFRENGKGYRHFDMVTMALVGAGINAIEFISSNMIPITMRHFFDSRLMISIIQDLNRVFGFVVQPYVATRGDTLRTRFGRRRPFYMIGLPLTVFFMLLLGSSPHVFTNEILRHSLPVLALLFFLNVLMQASQDISCGTEGPLYAELFPQKVLGRANSLRPIAGSVVQLIMFIGAMKLAMKDEFYPYLCSAGLAAFGLSIVVFAIREKPAPPRTSAQAEAYSVVKHARMLIDNREYLKIAIVGSVGLAMPAAFGLFLSLFATETLHLSKEAYGQAAWVGPVIVLVAALPAGWLADRVGAKNVIALAFSIQLIAALSIMFFAKDAFTLRIVIGVNAFGGAFQGVAMLPLIFLHAPAEDRGKVFGLIQFVRAFAATVVSPLIGLIADLTEGYRAGYSICVGLALIGIVAALLTRGGRPAEGAAAGAVGD
ncbi:MAG: MFS transporter [Candidatus Sumerlaeota bacterium]|nr:MFS transporter [Candidatus Sumerlaeota bacterium]